jgi:hypothetical protein
MTPHGITGLERVKPKDVHAPDVTICKYFRNICSIKTMVFPTHVKITKVSYIKIKIKRNFDVIEQTSYDATVPEKYTQKPLCVLTLEG